jgi:hypothetical protein
MISFIQTPNGLKSTDKLNHLIRTIESSNFNKYLNSKTTGFEVDFDAKWCLQIHFNNRSGFIALKEYGQEIRVWVYEYDNDLDPRIFVIKNYQIAQEAKLISLIKDCYRNFVK